MNANQTKSNEGTKWSWIEIQLMDFDRKWHANECPDVSEFVLSVSSDSSPKLSSQDLNLLTAELIKIDIEYRWRAGESKNAENYLNEFPGLQSQFQSELIDAEVEARCVAGRPPSFDELQSRYPNEAERLRQLIESTLQSRSSAQFPTDSSVQTVRVDDPGQVETEGEVFSNWSLKIGDRIGKYRLSRELGRGSFAIVWLAIDTKLNRPVAIKLIEKEKSERDDSLLPRLEREARAVALVDHPGVVKVHEFVKQGEFHFIVEQYVDGPNLEKLISQGQLSQRKSVSIVRDIALAAHAAHQQGIIHRDIKPGNILLGSDDCPRLVDFGLAFFETSNEATLTRQGDMLGTPAYMSPQQALAEHHRVDCRSDVYSLGAVLFHLLSESVPFEGSTLSVLNSVVTRPATTLFKRIPKKIPKDLETIILRCMEKEPESRFESAEALANDLSRYLNGEPILARPIGTAERMGKWIRRNPKASLAIGVVVLLGAMVLGSFLQLKRVSQQRNLANQNQQKAQAEMIQKTVVAGQLAMKRGRMEEARKYLETAMNSDQVTDLGVQLDWVECLIATRDIQSAFDAFQTISIPAGSAAEQSLLGRSQVIEAQLMMEQGYPLQEAEKRFLEASQLPIPIGLELFVEAMLADKTLDAIRSLRSSLDADPLHHSSHRMLVVLLFGLGEFDDALKQIDNALLLFPNDEDFSLMKSALIACTGDVELAFERLEKIDLSEEDQTQWKKICEQLNFISNNYSHFDGQAIDFNLAAMSDMARNYLEHVHPEFVRRGFFFPPKIADDFSELVIDLRAFFQGRLKESELVPRIQQILDVHPEGSLYCWVAGIQIANGKIEEAKASFLRACESSQFVSESDSVKWQGLFTTCAALWSRGQDRESQFVDGVRALREIENDPASVDKYSRSPSFANAVIQFSIDAMISKQADESLPLRWLDRAEETGSIEKAPGLWLRAVIANRNGRYLDALELLDQIEAADPDYKAILKDQFGGMRIQILERIERLKVNEDD